MTEMIAVDVVLLPPADVADQAIALSRALPPGESKGLALDAGRLPHVTLAQLFVAADQVAAALDAISGIAQRQPPVRLRVTGGSRGSSSVWMGIARTPEIVSLHERLMRAVEPFEQPEGEADAFYQKDARPGDVAWVTGFRRSASFERFQPHITLGHAKTPPVIAPFEFDATMLAACHLGRFCTCRTVLREWHLTRITTHRGTEAPRNSGT